MEFDSRALRERNHAMFDIRNTLITIIGCGAIGSFTASTFARMGVRRFDLYDFDRVAPENIGVQDFTVHQLNMKKVRAVRQNILSINPTASVRRFECKVGVDGGYITQCGAHFRDENRQMHELENMVTILCTDSMESRMEIVQDESLKTSPILSHSSNSYLFDARMGSETFQLYKFKLPLDMDEYMKTWYSDEDGDSEPCSARSTAYCSTLAGSMIASEVKKALSGGLPAEKIVFGFPALMLNSETDFSSLQVTNT